MAEGEAKELAGSRAVLVLNMGTRGLGDLGVRVWYKGQPPRTRKEPLGLTSSHPAS